MAELSPAAFAVVDAFVCANARKTDPSSNADVAAALRAAADHLNHPTSAHTLYAIADELEGADA